MHTRSAVMFIAKPWYCLSDGRRQQLIIIGMPKRKLISSSVDQNDETKEVAKRAHAQGEKVGH